MRLSRLNPFLLFLLAAHFLYAPAWQAGWVRDVSGWLQSLHTKTFPDYLLRRGMRVESLYPFTQAMLWVWWKVFGVSPLPWHVLFVSLHAFCAWGWMQFYNRIFKDKASGFFAGALLLLSPYATEVVVWKAGYHYLQGMLFLLATLFALLRYLESTSKTNSSTGIHHAGLDPASSAGDTHPIEITCGAASRCAQGRNDVVRSHDFFITRLFDESPLNTGNRRWIALGLCAFLPSLFALEAFYLTPVCVAVLLLHFRQNPLARSLSEKSEEDDCGKMFCHPAEGRGLTSAPPFSASKIAAQGRNDKTNNSTHISAFRVFLLPLLLLCVAQYFIYRSFYSRAVPHVGALHWEWITDYLRKPGKYIFHLFFFGRYWPEGVRVNVYEALNSWAFLIVFYSTLLTLLVKRRATLKEGISHPLFVPAAFGIAALLLVIPMHFHEEGLVYFDRYAYFMLPAVGAVLGHFLRGKIARAGVLLLSATLLLHTVLLWRKSDALSRKMLLSIPDFKDGKLTVLLNIPNALQSIPMIGQTREGEAALMRRYVLQKPFSGVVLEPSACNLFSLDDTVDVQRRDLLTRLVSQPVGGGWWTGGVPSTDWENEWFVVHFLPETRSYVLRLKDLASQYHVLVWKKGEWVEISGVFIPCNFEFYP